MNEFNKKKQSMITQKNALNGKLKSEKFWNIDKFADFLKIRGFVLVHKTRREDYKNCLHTKNLKSVILEPLIGDTLKLKYIHTSSV